MEISGKTAIVTGAASASASITDCSWVTSILTGNTCLLVPDS